MTDEEDLLEAYQGGNASEFSQYDIDNFNGKVLDHDEVDGDIEYLREDLMSRFDDDVYAGDEAIRLFGEMNKLYPEKYPQADDTYAPDEWYDKLRNINIDDEFRQHAEEATRAMAEADYDADPIFKWDLAEGDFQYTITGRESTGYQTEVYRSVEQGGTRIGQSTTGLDVVYSPTEAMVQVRSHNDSFDSYGHNTATKWHDNIVNTDAVSTYKETVITADSPSGTVFSGGQIHFPEKNKAFHLRTTEPNANTLYIEELQSDWAGDISKKGVKKGGNHIANLKAQITDLQKQDKAIVLDDRLAKTQKEKAKYSKELDAATAKKNSIRKEIQKLDKELDDEINAVPQSPLPNDKYINVGLRTAIAQAIDAGQTRVEWTPAQVHIERWSGRFEEMYKILYDKKLGGIAKRIANKYNAKAGQHYIEISPEMIAHHKSGKGDKLMATAPAIPAAQVANDKEDNS